MKDSRQPRATLRRLLGFLRPFRRGIALSIFYHVLTVASSIGLMMTSAWLVSRAAQQPSIADLGLAPALVRGFGVGRAFFRYLERLVSHQVTFRLLARLRVWFYERIEPLAPARLMQYRSGDLLSRVVSDIETLENVYIRVVAPPIVALVTGIAMTAIFFVFDPLLALILLVFMLVTGALLPWIAWRSGRGPGQARVAARAELNAALVDGIQGLADVVAYGQQAAQMAQLARHNEEMRAREHAIDSFDSLQSGLAVLLVNGAALLILAAAIGRIEGVLLATVTLGTVAAFEAITPLATAAAHLGMSLRAAERLFEVVDAEAAVDDPAQPAPAPDSAELVIEGLCFAYGPGEPLALDGVSLRAAPGERVAIVGPSGAGKSTLLNLLLRFWDYETGSIRLGGQELRTLAQVDVHRAFGVMSQRTHLFNTTLGENIRIARPDPDEAQLRAAAQQAQIDAFVAGLPQGYETYAGEGGAALSGGERQRIALARVLLKDAPILILDEATANLDAITERAVLANVLEAAAGRTLLMITHRLTLLERMDRITVLEGGRVAEEGTHAELVARGGLYARMLATQQGVLVG